jgi:hypothetical protein
LPPIGVRAVNGGGQTLQNQHPREAFAAAATDVKLVPVNEKPFLFSWRLQATNNAA